MTDAWPWLHNSYFGNTVAAYLISVACFLGGVLALWAAKKILFKRLEIWVKKTANKMDDAIVQLLESAVLPLCYVAAAYFALKQLTLSEGVDRLVHSVFVITFAVQVIRVGVSAGVFLVQQKFATGAASKTILTILRIVIWTVGLLFVLDNLGFDVNAVIAGLGIGGVAVALAAQTILGDLFNYFVIFFDKPFEEGDFIVVGDVMGEVNHVGIKTTRLIAISGEQIVCSNSDLTGSRIRNFKRMTRRRALFKIGVTYDTSPEKLKAIPGVIKAIIAKNPDSVFDRAHFQGFGDFSLNFEVVYYVLGSDYNKYMDIQQAINLAILQAFQKEGIEFAFPTQYHYVKTVSGGQPNVP